MNNEIGSNRHKYETIYLALIQYFLSLYIILQDNII